MFNTDFKTFGTLAIMIGCFAVIYPRFMHPFVLRAIGLNEPSNEGDNLPPGYKGSRPDMQKPAGGIDPKDIRRHIRPGPHPGMRAAAEMQKQNQQGSGRGMMGIVLPMYAVGIVLYLGYTLFKIFNRSNEKKKPLSRGRNSNYDGENDRMGFPRDYDGSGDVGQFLHDQEQRKNLEDLLTRVDDKNVSVEEMRVLQKRLEETEAQMTRILQAMRSVQTNVDTVSKAEDLTGLEEQTADSSVGAETCESAAKPSSEEEKGVPVMDSKQTVPSESTEGADSSTDKGKKDGVNAQGEKSEEKVPQESRTKEECSKEEQEACGENDVPEDELDSEDAPEDESNKNGVEGDTSNVPQETANTREEQ